LVGSEQVMRDQLEDDAARYQAGTVNGITYCRCEDIVTELKEFVKECALAGQLTRRLGATDDALRVTVSIDKGGSSTKAFITVWDADQSLSPLRAVLMGVYAGTDDRQSIKSVFGPAIAQVERAAANIDWPYQYNSTNSSSNNRTDSDSAQHFAAHNPPTPAELVRLYEEQPRHCRPDGRNPLLASGQRLFFRLLAAVESG
jgi:hypothetical protein